MKKLILSALVICLYTSVTAQVVSDRDQWTCSGTHENLYTQLNAGYTVIIAMQGLDCPGCNGNASYLDTFATNNKTKVRVWSALQLMAGSGGTCAQVQTWEQTHGYSDIFTFLDSTNHWMSTYSVEWLVIAPADKSIKYKGMDKDKAFTEARKIFDPTSVNEISAVNSINIYPNPAKDVINIDLKTDAQIAIYSLDGRAVTAENIIKGVNTINVSDLPVGMYILEVITEGGRMQSKFLKQ